MRAMKSGLQGTLAQRTPKSYRQVKGPDAPRWRSAMDEEFENMLKNKAYDLVSEETIMRERGRIGEDYEEKDGTKIYFIDPVWSYRIKTKNGAITKFKARLCANGRWMECSEDDTWLLTARMASIKTIFAIAATFGLTISSGDVPGAYLQAPINPKTVVYMREPPMFTRPDTHKKGK
jgi:Reverse transcriptase (RNA-dependent DNA polymerase)